MVSFCQTVAHHITSTGHNGICKVQPAQLLVCGSGRRPGPSTVAGAPQFHRLIGMRFGSRLWLACLATISLVAGGGESFAQEAGLIAA